MYFSIYRQFIFNADLEMDARNMDFKDDTFDCVINKATMDAILV